MKTMSLQEQADFMLSWFFRNGVSAVDIHLRCPKFKGAEYNSNNWIWLTHHKNLSLSMSRKLMKWCRFKNSRGSDIFIRPHRHDDQPIIFLDDLPLSRAKLVSEKYRSLVIQTSSNNTQVWLVLNRALDEARRKDVQKNIADYGYTDIGSISGEHLGRLTGYRSQKRKCWVTYVTHSFSIKYNPPEIMPSTLPRRGFCANKTLGGERSQSEKDFSWVLSQLRKGHTRASIQSELERHAEDREKPCPHRYAVRTIENAVRILT